MKVQQGSELALICSSESSSPATSLSWFKNEVEASNQGTSVVRDGDYNGLVTEQTYLQQFTSKVDNGAMLTCCVAGPCDDRDLCSAPCTLNVECLYTIYIFYYFHLQTNTGNYIMTHSGLLVSNS